MSLSAEILDPVPQLPAIAPGCIDHTCLRPDATPGDIARLCAEGRSFRFKTVCVQPSFVAFAAAALSGSDVGISAVVAFPHGASTTATKVFEARRAVAEGATELDVVANLGWIRGGDAHAIEAELRAVIGDGAGGVPVKVILETWLFSTEEIERAAHAALAAGAAFLKTSTGFATAAGPGTGATVADVRLLYQIAAGRARVKASGGIRSRALAHALLEAGADRIGCSASVALVAGA